MFTDPVVRCCECQNIMDRSDVQKYAGCPECGSKRVRNVTTLSEEEIAELREVSAYTEFLELFEGVE